MSMIILLVLKEEKGRFLSFLSSGQQMLSSLLFLLFFYFSLLDYEVCTKRKEDRRQTEKKGMQETWENFENIMSCAFKAVVSVTKTFHPVIHFEMKRILTKEHDFLECFPPDISLWWTLCFCSIFVGVTSSKSCREDKEINTKRPQLLSSIRVTSWNVSSVVSWWCSCGSFSIIIPLCLLTYHYMTKMTLMQPLITLFVKAVSVDAWQSLVLSFLTFSMNLNDIRSLKGQMNASHTILIPSWVL